MNIICRIFGHKWRWRGRSGVTDKPYSDEFLVYECMRCGVSCREKEDTGEKEMWW